MLFIWSRVLLLSDTCDNGWRNSVVISGHISLSEALYSGWAQSSKIRQRIKAHYTIFIYYYYIYIDTHTHSVIRVSPFFASLNFIFRRTLFLFAVVKFLLTLEPGPMILSEHWKKLLSNANHYFPRYITWMFAVFIVYSIILHLSGLN